MFTPPDTPPPDTPLSQFSLVNGMHTVLAFMTLCQDYVFPELTKASTPEGGKLSGDRSVTSAGQGEAREYVLLKYDSMPRKQQVMAHAPPFRPIALGRGKSVCR